MLNIMYFSLFQLHESIFLHVSKAIKCESSGNNVLLNSYISYFGSDISCMSTFSSLFNHNQSDFYPYSIRLYNSGFKSGSTWGDSTTTHLSRFLRTHFNFGDVASFFYKSKICCFCVGGNVFFCGSILLLEPRTNLQMMAA